MERYQERTHLLDEATEIISTVRNATYGEPHQDFARTAKIWNVLMDGNDSTNPFEAHHVAMFMIAIKLSRLCWSPDHRDSWLDIAGYAGCGHEAYVMTHLEDRKPEWRAEENLPTVRLAPCTYRDSMDRRCIKNAGHDAQHHFAGHTESTPNL